ncbi:unnamed protein product [Somion occarium]|uniref:Uncharacterized protein n=1 Tax=Somion occarium TaxID=3059160 RepID=A0ABP1D5Z1_9APHY
MHNLGHIPGNTGDILRIVPIRILSSRTNEKHNVHYGNVRRIVWPSKDFSPPPCADVRGQHESNIPRVSTDWMMPIDSTFLLFLGIWRFILSLYALDSGDSTVEDKGGHLGVASTTASIGSPRLLKHMTLSLFADGDVIRSLVGPLH